MLYALSIKAESRIEQEVLSVERRWVDAHRSLNLDEIDAILADDYVQIQQDGTVSGRQAVLASYQSGERSWSYAESDEYDLRVTETMAVLIGRWRGCGVNSGHEFDYTARFTSVYVLRNGSWQLMLDQSTEITNGV